MLSHRKEQPRKAEQYLTVLLNSITMFQFIINIADKLVSLGFRKQFKIR